MREIAREAGVAERTVYVAFKDKVSILTSIADHLFYGGTDEGEGQAEFRESLRSVADPIERLKMLAHQSATDFEQGLAALARMVIAAAQSDSRLAEFVAEMVPVRITLVSRNASRDSPIPIRSGARHRAEPSRCEMTLRQR